MIKEEIKRPYISGLDDTNLSNLLKSWFKHERLTSVSEEDQEIIREELQEYANQLDESRLEADNFIDGMLAMRPVSVDKGSKKQVFNKFKIIEPLPKPLEDPDMPDLKKQAVLDRYEQNIHFVASILGYLLLCGVITVFVLKLINIL